MGIKVVATRRGYYGQLLEPGQLFEIPNEKFFNEKWMKKFEEKKDKAKPAPARKNRKASKVIEQKAETFTDAIDSGLTEETDNWD